MTIAQNIERITAQLPKGVKLVAVSKFHPIDKIMEAYDAGQRIFGENRAQELAAKAPQLPTDIEWHFIGHLQKNKVRMIMPWATTIQSIDSIELLQLVNKEAARINRHVNVLLQLHVAKEQTKSGFTIEEVLLAANEEAFNNLSNVTIAGVMAMATFTDDMDQVASEFETVHNTFLTLRDKHFADNPDFKEISMGMSDDWHVAVQHGATLVRIGTDIFGAREY
ncbi:MAG: YggS family pyridoxal phosphate-dependent enzyme [Muribaculaceae bacterium]|nr:YggS family pyridoxal phosphate-dependent enzyme [Muribaculaceae bacterium]MBR6490111.1 YggS family pyridoxal phosphate-dependent enzyme [Muribaculaceae bacterium]